MSFSTLAQFGIFGLRREALLPRMRAVTIVDPDTDSLGVAAHDWAGDEYVQIATVPGSVDGGDPVLPAGLSASTVYRPLPVAGSDSLFKLSTTEGGSPVSITDAGAGSFTVSEQLSGTIQRLLDGNQATIIEALVAYKAPIADSPAPLILVKVECWLTAYEAAVTHGLVVPGYWGQARQTIEALYERAQRHLEEWRAGKQVAGISTDATPGLGENDSVVIESGLSPNWIPTCNGREVLA